MKKFYVITFYSVDGPTCDDDGFVDCANGGLFSKQLFETKEDAIKARDQVVEEEMAEHCGEDGCYSTEDGYSYETGEMSMPDSIYIDYYYGAEIVNKEVIMIEEVSL